MRPPRTGPTLAGVLLLASADCGLTSGSPMVDDVEPGSIGQGKPLAGADLTVTSKEFTEQLILGAVMGIAFQAAGADVLDRTGIQGSIGAREAVKGGDADAMYEYTGTAWITYQGNSEPIPDPRKQWEAVREADLKHGLTWLPPPSLNNAYAGAEHEGGRGRGGSARGGAGVDEGGGGSSRAGSRRRSQIPSTSGCRGLGPGPDSSPGISSSGLSSSAPTPSPSPAPPARSPHPSASSPV